LKRPTKPAKPTKATTSTTSASADAIIRLIDHAKKQGIAYFKGPDGIEFTFRREAPKPNDAKAVKDVGDDWIP
jgi:hypothetical protein